MTDIETIKRNGNSSNNHVYNDDSQFHSTTTISIPFMKQEEILLSSFAKRILIIDDNADISLTFKKGLETENDENNKTLFKVYTYNDPLEALSHFKPNFYDLLLVDINMPKMDDFGFSSKVLKLDVNVRILYVIRADNQEALREQYPTLSIGCFLRKPVSIEFLIRRVKEELE